MLLLASYLRGMRRLVIASAAIALVAITWTTVVRFVARPTPGRLSEYLLALGAPLLRPFDSLDRPATFSNGGTFSWTALAAAVVYALLGIGVAWLFARASDRVLERHAAMQGPSLEELREKAPLSDGNGPLSLGPPENNARAH